MATATVAASPEVEQPRITMAEGSPKPKRKYRKRKKRAGSRPRRVLNPAPNPSPVAANDPPAATMATSSIPSISSEDRAAQFAAATAAVPDVIGETAAVPGALPAPGPAVPGAPASEIAEAFGPDFLAIAQEYLPKAFEIAGAIFDNDYWQLSKLQTKILVPECAGCLEELYPEWKKIVGDWNLKYPRTVQFGMALSIPVIVRIMHQWKTHKEKKAGPKAPATYPGGPAPATPMPASPASSDSSGSPVAEKVTGHGGSFTFARG